MHDQDDPAASYDPRTWARPSEAAMPAAVYPAEGGRTPTAAPAMVDPGLTPSTAHSRLVALAAAITLLLLGALVAFAARPEPPVAAARQSVEADRTAG